MEQAMRPFFARVSVRMCLTAAAFALPGIIHYNE